MHAHILQFEHRSDGIARFSFIGIVPQSSKRLEPPILARMHGFFIHCTTSPSKNKNLLSLFKDYYFTFNLLYASFRVTNSTSSKFIANEIKLSKSFNASVALPSFVVDSELCVITTNGNGLIDLSALL